MVAKKQSAFEKILFGINQTIFNGQLTDIVEVTYAYKEVQEGLYWNETVFGYFAGFRYDSGLDMEIVKTVTERKLKDKLRLITEALKDLQAIEKLSEAEKIKKGILIGSLKYVKNCVNVTLLGLDFELEKAGYSHDLSHLDIQERIKKIEKLEKLNFGGLISENSKESALVYNYVYKIYKKNKKRLSKDEQSEYENVFLKKIKEYVPDDFESFPINRKRKFKYDSKLEKRLDEKLSRKKYTKIFEKVLNDFLGLGFRVIHEERSSVYDGPGYLAIPIDKSYDTMTKRRVIELIGHEIEVHCYNYRINQFLLGNFRGAGNLPKEEGLAMTIEQFLKGSRLEDISITHHFVRVFASEIFYVQDLKRFLMLYSKLNGDKYSPLRILRQKRNYPLSFKGGQHKDASYGRGIQEVLDFLQSGGDMRELYLGKIAIKDIGKIKKLLNLRGTEISDLQIPIFLGELIMYISVHDNRNISCDSFLDHLKSKYHFINFDKLNLLIVKEFVKLRTTFSDKSLKI